MTDGDEVVLDWYADDPGEMPVWYHDPASYSGEPSNLMMTQAEAEAEGHQPCPSCFPDTEFAENYEVQQVETRSGDTVTDFKFTGTIEDLEAMEE